MVTPITFGILSPKSEKKSSSLYAAFSKSCLNSLDNAYLNIVVLPVPACPVSTRTLSWKEFPIGFRIKSSIASSAFCCDGVGLKFIFSYVFIIKILLLALLVIDYHNHYEKG